MPYRGPQPNRQFYQVDTILQHAGNTATWRQYVSASAGVDAAGMGAVNSYRECVITAVMGNRFRLPELMEAQQAAGMIAAGQFFVTTRETLGVRDELIWRGEVYRVEADSVPSRLAGLMVTQVKRGEQ